MCICCQYMYMYTYACCATKTKKNVLHAHLTPGNNTFPLHSYIFIFTWGDQRKSAEDTKKCLELSTTIIIFISTTQDNVKVQGYSLWLPKRSKLTSFHCCWLGLRYKRMFGIYSMQSNTTKYRYMCECGLFVMLAELSLG